MTKSATDTSAVEMAPADRRCSRRRSCSNAVTGGTTSRSDIRRLALILPVVMVVTFIHAMRASTLHYMYRKFVCNDAASSNDFPYECVHIDGRRRRLNVASSLLEGIVSLLSAGLWGHIGDVYGRAVPFLVSIMGGIIIDMYFFLMPRATFVQQHAIFWAIFANVASACLGGSTAAVGAAHAFFAFTLLVGVSMLMANVGGTLGFRTTQLWSADPRLCGLGFLVTAAASAVVALYVRVVFPKISKEASRRLLKPFTAVSAVLSDRRFCLLCGVTFTSGLAWPVHKLWTVIFRPSARRYQIRGAAIEHWIHLYKVESLLLVLFVIPGAAWYFTRRARRRGLSGIFDVAWLSATLYLLADLIPAGGMCVLAVSTPEVASMLAVLSPLRIGSKPALFAMASFLNSRPQLHAEAQQSTSDENTRHIGVKMGVLTALYHLGASISNLVFPILISKKSPSMPRHLPVFALEIALLNISLTFLGPLCASVSRRVSDATPPTYLPLGQNKEPLTAENEPVVQQDQIGKLALLCRWIIHPKNDVLVIMPYSERRSSTNKEVPKKHSWLCLAAASSSRGHMPYVPYVVSNPTGSCRSCRILQSDVPSQTPEDSGRH
ncbi:hypothetical protein FISHEDRAFT_58461 [Fistulina hepatica ATCC 64428]|uniref:MFS general substrate transporter n=1 Tax=Fistulina hepatica ATCC 64428 TaxID=1128425 RepID=A0A0D7AEN4_9AGAR|nr:hypothetical protein FISHEDRAFT_58461 [Fistulina hepatica ATCC 64428]